MAEEVISEELAPAVDPALAEAEAADEKEWQDATEELFPELAKKESKDNEQTDTTTTTTVEPAPETTTTTTIDPGETAEQKSARIEAANEEDGAIDTASIDARVAAREAAQVAEVARADVRSKMFADQPQVLQDADGDPIRTIADVMKLRNPITGESFTEAEAATWLVSAQQQFNQNLAQIDNQIDQIAEVQLDLKDQADMITYEYGELLKAMPELQKKLWVEYEKTLITDSKTGIITKAPVSLNNFYRMALKPYVDLAAKLEANTVEQTEADKSAAEKAASDAAAAKKSNRQDRSDIYGGGKDDARTDDEKEWGAAAEVVFGDQLRNRK